MLTGLTEAVDAIAAALETDRFSAVAAVDIDAVKLMLDVVYAGTRQPVHATVLDGIAAMCMHGLRAPAKFVTVRRERCLAALVVAVGGRHGLELDLRPIVEVERQLAVFRDNPDVKASHIRDWLVGRVRAGDPGQPLVPLDSSTAIRGVVVGISRPISQTERAGLARDNFIVRSITNGVAARGGRVLTPIPRSAQGAEPWRTDAILRSDACGRAGKATVVVALGDEPSGGVGVEIATAAALRVPVVLVKSEPGMSVRLDPASVDVIPYGTHVTAAAARVMDWFAENTWRMANSARRRADRELVHARVRTALSTQWNARSTTQRQLVAEICATCVETIDLALRSATGMELAGSGLIGQLHAVLGVPRPGPMSQEPRLTTPELESLTRVCEIRELGVMDAFLASEQLLIELASRGDRRGALDDDLWHRFFDRLGLDGRNR